MSGEKPILTRGQLVFSIIYPFVYLALMFALAGDARWAAGWIYGVWFLVMYAVIMIYLYRRDPDLLAERFRAPGTANQKTWDQYFLYVMIAGFLAWFVVAPLDARRYHWTHHFPVWLQALGVAALLISLFFLYRAFTDNHYLSPLVRIQTERKHEVVSTGVYGLVRHPMYLGAILMMAGVPMLLGSAYGIVLGVLISLGIVGRILGEEKMLSEELEGYSDYRRKVRYRLVPHVW
jgi:protein-S-isoprenylcysteine O-methyltransferase Ste14